MRPNFKAISSAMFLVALVSAGIAESKESAGVNFPDQTQVDGTDLEG